MINDSGLPNRELKIISLDKLRPFKNHPFKLYEGQQFHDMVESIKTHGVLVPIVVRPLPGEDKSDVYEILSGHNRVEATKAAGFEQIFAFVRRDLSDEEATLVVTETNLLQRSFSDLSHSERAVTLAMHYEAIKKQGRRTDLINDIENMLESYGDIDSNVNFSTSAQIVQKLNSRDRMAQDFGLNRGMIARYVRINKLIDPLKKRLDNKKLGLIPAVELSYLTHDEQSDVDMVLDSSPQAKLDIKKAKIMRQFSEKKNLTAGKIDDILAGYVGKKRNRAIKPAAFKIKAKIMSKYFQNGYEVKEAEEIITQALDLYFSSRQ